MQIKNPSHYANKNYSTTHKLILVFMTVTHHRKPNFHQIKKKKKEIMIFELLKEILRLHKRFIPNNLQTQV